MKRIICWFRGHNFAIVTFNVKELFMPIIPQEIEVTTHAESRYLKCVRCGKISNYTHSVMVKR